MTKCITIEYPDGSIVIRGGIGPWMLARFDGDADAARQYILDELVPVQNPGGVARIEDIAFPPDKEFRNAWRRGGGGNIEIPLPKAQTLTRKIMTRLVRQEMTFLDDRRVQAQIENDTALVGQIDARKTDLQATIIPQVRDGIAAATSLADLQTVKQAYLTGRPQAVKDALP